MLNKFFTKPIELTIGEQNLTLNSLADFEFSLAGRTSVPSKKITGMVKFSLDELKNEARSIKDVERRFVSILSKSIEEPSSIGRALREIDAQIFSQDHNWRLIVSALRHGDDDLNEFRRIALVKYMQYLSSRQEIIKHLYLEKKRYVRTTVSPNSTYPHNVYKDAKKEINKDLKSIPDVYHYAEMEKMVKGEYVTIHMKTGKDILILLSNNQCKIVSDNSGIKFIDDSGRSCDLKVGKNMIGRDSRSDIRMNAKLRDISRTHLIIEINDSDTLYLTDLSSHGTSLPAKYLESQIF
jgi:hypothetical protein